MENKNYQDLCNEAKKLGKKINESGSVLYSPIDTLSKGKFYLLGINPGGSDFESIDEQPVDLIFLLLAPESAGADHLKALARVSRLLRDASMCEKLRGAKSADGLYMLLTQSEAQAA